MTQEQHNIHDGGNFIISNPDIADSGKIPAVDEIQDKIKILSHARINKSKSIDDLRVSNSELVAKLRATLIEEKKLRIARARLSRERDQYSSLVLDKKRLRLKLQETLFDKRQKLSEARRQVGTDTDNVWEQAKRKYNEMQTELETLAESLNVHRRDRYVVLGLLAESQAELQDQLTEVILWKIHFVQIQAVREGDESEGKAGIMAELLGRLLVLEKEESRLRGLLDEAVREGIRRTSYPI